MRRHALPCLAALAGLVACNAAFGVDDLGYGTAATGVGGTTAPAVSASSAGGGGASATGTSTTNSGVSSSSGASSGGAGGGSGLSLLDDELANEFGAGTMSNVMWNGSALELEAGRSSGTFTSRVFDALSPDTVWTHVTLGVDTVWGKPLPGAGESDGPLGGGVSMNANVLLLRFDDPEPLRDASPSQNDATALGNIDLDPGLFRNSFDDTMTSAMFVPYDTDLDFGTGDFTWAYWVETNADCAGNHVHMGIEDQGTDRAHLWLGCMESDVCPNSGADGGRAASYLRSKHNEADGTGFCGQTRINDGNWHHVALVKQGHGNSLVQIYVDGQLDGSQSGAFVEPIAFFDDPGFGVGAFSGPSYQSEGRFDEVVIFRRALGASEIANLHRRGASRVTFEVRGCNDPTCSSGGFDSPTGGYALPSSASFTAPPVPLESGVTGQYFQYRLTLERLHTSEPSPRITSVGMSVR